MGPSTHFPDAVFAEVFVVAENDDFVGHGCTDIEPILNLKSNRGTRLSRVCILTAAKSGREHQYRAGLSTLALRTLWTR